MPNNIAFARNYTSVIDEVHQRASVSGVLNSGRRMVRAGHNAKETPIPKISVTGLGNYTRNVGYKTGAITYEFETKTFNYNRGPQYNSRLLARWDEDHDIRFSVGRTSSRHDNAVAESFFGTLKNEMYSLRK